MKLNRRFLVTLKLVTMFLLHFSLALLLVQLFMVHFPNLEPTGYAHFVTHFRMLATNKRCWWHRFRSFLAKIVTNAIFVINIHPDRTTVVKIFHIHLIKDLRTNPRPIRKTKIIFIFKWMYFNLGFSFIRFVWLQWMTCKEGLKWGLRDWFRDYKKAFWSTFEGL